MLWGHRFYRAALIIFLLVFSFPQTVFAKQEAAITVNFDVIAVKRDVSVTIRTRNFPVRTKFTARMDVVAKKAVNGQIVGEFNSEKGGVLDQTFTIPESLKGEIILALRIESADGYVAYNWFFNENAITALPDPKAKPEVDFSEAKKNTAVTVAAKNLPPNTAFWVRVGPYENFYSKYAFLNRITTGNDGTLKFPVELPASTKDAEYIMVRLDGGGMYAFNVYQNIDGGKAVPLTQVNKLVECNAIPFNTIPVLNPREDFDVVWRVQNTGLKDWEKEHVMFLFTGGTAMQKYKDRQFLPDDIKRGEVHDFVVDMRAPEKSGWYKAYWTVKNVAEGSEKDLCKLSVSIFVK